jgi:hypothetical protein
MADDPIFKNAVKRLDAVNGDVNQLPDVFKTVLLVNAAQGMFGNGGLQYFFENDWPNQPPYKVFSDAYRRIGAHESADMLDRAVALLGIDHPERNAPLREQRMEELCSDEVSEFAELSGKLCMDQSAWKKLDQFMEQNREILLATQA